MVIKEAKRPTVASFFTGIGGFDLGFQQAGFEVVYQCEIDKYCQSILQRHWPDVPKEKDIKKAGVESIIPSADVWVGGFPCQDISLAGVGPRPGLAGEKSGLFYEFYRLVERYSPGVFVLENVCGLLCSNQGNDIKIILEKFTKLGYCVGWRVCNSKNFRVAQSRRRIFLVGCYRNRSGPAKILFEPSCSKRTATAIQENQKFRIQIPGKSSGETRKSVIVNSDIARCLITQPAGIFSNYVSYPNGTARKLMPVEYERLQGFPDGWTTPGSDLRRYRALGNAVTVPVAKWLAGGIYRYLDAHKNTQSRNYS